MNTFARLSRADRKEQTRQALLEAGRTLFARDGFHATTLDRIAAEAGFTKGAVYASFPTKADLFLAIFEARVDERVPRIRAFGARARSLDAYSKAMIRDWQRVLRDEHEWSLLLIEFWVHAARTPDLRDRLEAQRHRIRDAVVEAARAAGGEEVLAMDVEEFMSAQLALANGYNLEALLEPESAPARLADVVAGLRAARRLTTHDRLDRARLLAWQAERVRELEVFACARSPFYRDRDPSQTLEKATLMANYDDVLTDRRLSLAGLDAHIDALGGDELLDGEYRVMATGGTTGRRAVVPFSRAEWRMAVAAFFRWTAITGRKPAPRRRVAVVLAPAPRHMTWRYARTVDVGLLNVLRLDAARTPEDLVAALNAFRPQEISGYPSALALLAHAQLEGRLRIAPRFVATSSEVRTPEMEAAMVDAWGVRPFDMYGITEGGITATDCPEHAGLHVLEDQVRVEVLDDDGAPVPEGEVGRLVVTPLHGRTLPLLRYEMGDLVRATTAPCPCGRPYLRLLEIQGRQDDVLALPATRGGTVAVHPILVRSPMAAVPGLDRYQLVSAEGMLRVRVTLRPGTDAARATTAARDGLQAALRDVGAAAGVEVELVDDIPCSALGKHRLVAQA